MFICGNMTDHSSWNEVSHYRDTKLSCRHNQIESPLGKTGRITGKTRALPCGFTLDRIASVCTRRFWLKNLRIPCGIHVVGLVGCRGPMPPDPAPMRPLPSSPTRIWILLHILNENVFTHVYIPNRIGIRWISCEQACQDLRPWSFVLGARHGNYPLYGINIDVQSTMACMGISM